MIIFNLNVSCDRIMVYNFLLCIMMKCWIMILFILLKSFYFKDSMFVCGVIIKWKLKIGVLLLINGFYIIN